MRDYFNLIRPYCTVWLQPYSIQYTRTAIIFDYSSATVYI